ncbi:MAG: hypothetical protein JSV96_09290 [Candidatus Aminicenantes bacterium]|nr:MAG: hypothetical protein JSV96_09290 [Candidatus Aminicenantes bacterium]
MNDEPFYFVVLKNPGSFNHNSLADALASSLSVLKVDAVMHLKNFWGLLHKTQEIERAQELQEKLRQWGIETFVISTPEIKQLPAVKVLKQASLEEHGLAFEEEGQKKSVPWNSFVLVCAGQVIEIETVKRRTVGDGHYAKHLVTTGVSFVSAVRISADRLKGKEVIEKKPGTTFLLDLIAAENSESIRIIGNSFNYSCLGDRMGYNVLMNFKNLYQEISKSMINVVKNQGARAIDTDDMAKLKYTSENSFENEMLWLMQLTSRSPD